MKKILVILTFVLLTLSLVSCSENEIIEFGVITENESYFAKPGEDFLFGTSMFGSYRYPDVYHFNKSNKLLQLQPKRIGNTIYNLDSDWFKIETIQSMGNANVVYYEKETETTGSYKPLTNGGIEIFLITYHTTFSNTLTIHEIYVVNLKDIENFEYDYKVI